MTGPLALCSGVVRLCVRACKRLSDVHGESERIARVYITTDLLIDAWCSSGIMRRASELIRRWRADKRYKCAAQLLQSRLANCNIRASHPASQRQCLDDPQPRHTTICVRVRGAGLLCTAQTWNWVIGSRPGHRVIILTRYETRVFQFFEKSLG